MQPANIDLWLKKLLPSDAEHYWQFLDAQERTKALSFIQEQHRCLYVCCHGLLRIILASYLNTTPEHLKFAQAEFGKPYLPNIPLYFNMSHSADLMLLAVTKQTEIGVDIEAWNDHIDDAIIAKYCFADSEQNYWQQSNNKTAVFYQLWTRKESFIKAVGAGLNLNVAEVETAIPDARFLKLPTAYGKADLWQLIDLEVEKNYSAALTVPSTYDWHWRWRTKIGIV